jgi:hypothetical protein
MIKASIARPHGDESIRGALPNNRADHTSLSVIVVCERDNNESSYTSMKHLHDSFGS